jgi:DNA-binding winged helix-turn-helix (wHTH) protein/Flp pilus assembly protein TadD
MAARERYAFGELTLDATERRLQRAGQPIPLAPKALDVLITIVRSAGTLVTKRELLELVWPGSFVEEGILAVHVSALRKALGDGENGRQYIETVSRSGYRFIGAVTEPPNAVAPSQDPPKDPEVYELVGRGRAHLLSASMFEVPKAVAAFRAAIALDPTYAAAHAGLALACCAQAFYRVVPHADAYSEARAAALRALAMDASCADAQVALGAVLFFAEWNWAGAEKSLARALDINPNHTEAYLLYGQLKEALGQLEQGLHLKLKALDRDPFSPLVHLQISLSYWNQGRYADSIEWANRALTLDPRHPHAREHLAGAYLKQGDFDRHMAENVTHARLHGVPAEALDPLKQAYAAGGRAGVVRLVLERAASQPHAFPAMQLAVFSGEAGDLDAAFRHLDRAIDSHDPALMHLAVAPQWESLRGDPRFNQCLARMGLDPCALAGG